MSFVRIRAAAHAAPERIVSNDELAQQMDTSDDWIRSRTGIAQRHIATAEENTSDLATKVAQQLLTRADLAAEELDFIIVATMTPDSLMPSTAALVQARIGAVNAFAYDLTAACSGFVYALSQAEKLISSGVYRRGLVIGAEVLSRVLDWTDRSTAVLFGDGAGGVLLDNTGSEALILSEKLQADGSRGASLTLGKKYIAMDGRAIFDFAVRDVPKNIAEVAANYEIDYYLLHQANSRILDKMAKKLDQPRDKFLQNMQDYGNTSAASVPILLSEMLNNETLKLDSGQKLILTGFGGGLTWGSLLVQI